MKNTVELLDDERIAGQSAKDALLGGGGGESSLNAPLISRTNGGNHGHGHDEEFHSATDFSHAEPRTTIEQLGE
jgi:hypothetical protein